MAPEVVQKKEYNEKCDVWSLGIILYFILTGEKPYDGEDINDIFQSIISNKFQKSIFFTKNINKIFQYK